MWVRIMGLPLHLWGMNFFKRLGDACGRFVSVDEDTMERRNLQWARILVGVRGWNLLSSLWLVTGFICFTVQLWWETAPWISEVQSSWCCTGRGGKVEGEVGSRAFLRVAEDCSGKEVGQVLMVDPLPSTKEGEDSAPFLTGTAVDTDRKGKLSGTRALGAWLGSELEALASDSWALGSAFGGSLKRLSLGQAQLEVGRACSSNSGETLLSSPRSHLHLQSPRLPFSVTGPLSATGPSQGTIHYAYFPAGPSQGVVLCAFLHV